jgi:uncharacterized protein YggU (UPF0235/DUF167 family)
VSGEKSRDKRVRIGGMTPADLASRIAALADGPASAT